MNVLFLCVANSARSQLAEGLARALYGKKHRFASAGSVPGRLNPFAVEALREIDIDITSHRSKSIAELEPDFVASLDCVVTLCAEEVCPVMPGRVRREHWPLPDPASATGSDAEKLAKFRATREALRPRLAQLLGPPER